MSYRPLRDWRDSGDYPFSVTVEGGRVTEFNLHSDYWRENGRLPSALGNLTGLKKLVIDGTPTLTGDIRALGKLTELEEVQITETGLGGEIPSELANISNLQVLNLSNNGFDGAIPSELGKLVNLEQLNLSKNRLNGPVPPELGNLSALKLLNLARNRLSGPIPQQLGNLTSIEKLFLDNNQFSGELPTQLGELPNLQVVSFWDNRLTWPDSYPPGILADTVALVALYEKLFQHNQPSQGFLRNQRNWLSHDPIDTWSITGGRYDYYRLVIGVQGGRVTSLWIGGTYLKGELPQEIGLLTGLKTLFLHRHWSDLTGCIPSSLQGVELTGDLNLPFCTGPTSKKALSPPGTSLLG